MKENVRVQPRRIVGQFLSAPQNTNVIARTTDAFIGVNRDTRALEDAKMIEGLVGSTIKVGAQVRADNAEEDALKGRNDAVMGREMDAPNGLFHSTKAYTEAYQGVKDEAQGIRFRDEYLTILRENDYFINTADPEAQQQDIYKQLFENYFGGDYLTKHGRDGLLTDRGLARIEEAKLLANSEFAKRGIEYRKEGFLNDTYTLVSDVVDVMLGANKINPDMLSASIDSNFEDYVKNNGNLVSKAEYQGIVLDRLSQKAIEKARTGDTEGASKMVEMLKGLRDKEGLIYDKITGSDPKNGKIKYGFRDTINGLEAQIQQEVVAMERIKKEAQEEAMEQTYAQYVVGVADLTNEGLNVTNRYAKVAQMRDQLRQDIMTGRIKASQGGSLLNKLDDMYNQKTSKKSDSGTFRSAIAYVNRPNANFDEFVKVFGDGLSDRDFLTLSNKLQSSQNAYTKEMDQATKNAYDKYSSSLVSEGKKTLNTNTLLTINDEFGDARAGMFESTYYATVGHFLKTNDRPPTYLELAEIAEKAKELANKQYPPKGKKGGKDGNNKSADGSTEKEGSGGKGGPDFGGFDK